MKVLVTGANGFIGSELVRRLVREDHQVNCLIHRSKQRLQGQAVNIFNGSVTQPDTLPVALQGVELVYHLAGRATDWGSKKQFFETNTAGTRNLLDAAIKARCKRLVLVSSLAVHRFTGHVDSDEKTPADQNRYAYSASKAAAEQLVMDAHEKGQIEGTIVRPGVVVFGPHDTTSFIYMAPLLQNGRWTHVRRGKPLLCYSYVENLANGLILAGTHPRAAGETFIITDDLQLTWKKLISEVIAAFGVEEKSMSFAAPVARTAGITLEGIYKLFRRKNPPPITDYRTALVSRDFHFSCEKAKKTLGYQPEVSFKEGVRRTVAWYKTWKD